MMGWDCEVQTYAFCIILIAASIIDIRTRTVPDMIHILILLAGLPGIHPVRSVIGFIVVPLPFLAAAFLKPGSIGGGDIKLMAACGFFMGAVGGIQAMMAGLMLAVLVQGILLCRREEPFALVPYLTIGCMVVIMMNIWRKIT